MTTMDVKDANAATVAIEKPNANGRAAAAASRPVVLSTEDLAKLDAILTKLSADPATQTTLAAVLAALASVAVTGPLTDAQLRATAVPVSVSGVATAANQTTLIALVPRELTDNGGLKAGLVEALPAGTNAIGKVSIDTDLTAGEYETVAAGQTDQAIGATGASGDYLAGLLIVPATTSPGAVSIKDGGGGAITVFTGGSSSVSNLVPFFIPLGLKSASGAWKVTTGANVSAIASGNFT